MCRRNRRGESPSMDDHKAVKHHTDAAAHEQAAHHALLAHAHMQHAGEFMSDAAKIHAELHGGNKHTLIG